jgi:hypothetical protein
MKTTLELPDALMKRVKLRAIQHNQKLKDAIAVTGTRHGGLEIQRYASSAKTGAA